MTEPSKELDELKQMRNDIVNSVANDTFDSLKNEPKYLNMTFEKAGAACRDLAEEEVAEYEKALINSQLLLLINRIEDEVLGMNKVVLNDIYGDKWRNNYGYNEIQVGGAANWLLDKQRTKLQKIMKELRKEN